MTEKHRISGSQSIKGFILSPDQSLIATANAEGHLRFLDVAEAREISNRQTESGIDYLCFNPMHFLLGMVLEGVVQILDIDSMNFVAELRPTDRDRPSAATCCGFSSDGGRLFVGCRSGKIYVWDISELAKAY
eukprot:c18870_g1_i2.p1 GENE.c18870_g1_i2~~c18870_g1_i2.p1  ORF type:complete len:133 (-),score=22.87 c18870_g1_i2:124-522(-)